MKLFTRDHCQFNHNIEVKYTLLPMFKTKDSTFVSKHALSNEEAPVHHQAIATNFCRIVLQVLGTVCYTQIEEIVHVDSTVSRYNDFMMEQLRKLSTTTSS